MEVEQVCQIMSLQEEEVFLAEEEEAITVPVKFMVQTDLQAVAVPIMPALTRATLPARIPGMAR